MANRFTQTFTLKDIFTNRRLAGKLPLIDVKRNDCKESHASVQTSVKSVSRLVYDTSVSAARPFYKPLKASKSGDTITVGGTLTGDYNEAVDAVYEALRAQAGVIKFTANNAEIIRSALKESENNARIYGQRSKLFLRVQSMQQIEAMTKRELMGLMDNIMENIIYGDDFPKTKAKFNAEGIGAASGYSYAEMQRLWKIKIGDI